MRNSLTAMDLFCGAGGLSLGFQQAGFRVLAGNDCDASAMRTFCGSHPQAEFLYGPIENFSGDDFLKACDLERNELDCLIGGPPCQAYSVYNHQRGMHDKRSFLFYEYLRIVKDLNPRWIVIENVTGILSIANGEPAKDIVDGLEKLGYRVELKILKSEDFGVPQERRRVVFLGNRIDADICWPEPLFGVGNHPFVTVSEAINDLPALKNGGELFDVPYPSSPKSAFQLEMRMHSNTVKNHSAPKLGAINLERLKHIPEGGSWRDIPYELLPNGMKSAKRSDHTKRYGRLRRDGLSSTILTKCDIHWGAFIHPEQDRAISVREAARLQAFPDTTEFFGSKTEQYVQIGNAVPPLMGKHIAGAIMLADNQRVWNEQVLSKKRNSRQ